MHLRQLPRTDDLRKVADSIGTRLRDDVISTGTFDIGAMVVVGAPARALTDRELASLNVDLAAKIAKLHQDTPPADLAAHTKVEPFGGERVTATGKHLAAVYAYDPASGADEKLAKTVWVLTAKAGIKPANGRVVTSRSRFWDKGTSSHKYFTQTLFFNGETSRALAFYMISGTM